MSKSPWVRVEDGLPNIDPDYRYNNRIEQSSILCVLRLTDGLYLNEGSSPQFGVYPIEIGRLVRYTNSDSIWNVTTRCLYMDVNDITHWMPIPELPEVE
ncbi:MAG: DUF551 domain-containing protein [Alphaproteobacteria bacterium]|nr:DUF551 domain-containing protein [Alphaproteobacteria bacterium]